MTGDSTTGGQYKYGAMIHSRSTQNNEYIIFDQRLTSHDARISMSPLTRCAPVINRLAERVFCSTENSNSSSIDIVSDNDAHNSVRLIL